MLGINQSDVTVNVTLLGGGFGRKSKPDYVAEAAYLARAVGAPVKVTWSREDDLAHGYTTRSPHSIWRADWVSMASPSRGCTEPCSPRSVRPSRRTRYTDRPANSARASWTCRSISPMCDARTAAPRRTCGLAGTGRSTTFRTLSPSAHSSTSWRLRPARIRCSSCWRCWAHRANLTRTVWVPTMPTMAPHSTNTRSTSAACATWCCWRRRVRDGARSCRRGTGAASLCIAAS